MEQKQIDRINELARKAKTPEGLAEWERVSRRGAALSRRADRRADQTSTVGEPRRQPRSNQHRRDDGRPIRACPQLKREVYLALPMSVSASSSGVVRPTIFLSSRTKVTGSKVLTLK